MSEMQLQLNISSNATVAEQGLNRLAGAMQRVRNAATNGMGLAAAATGITRIISALSAGIPETTVTRLQQIANALGQIKNIGPVGLNISTGSVASVNSIMNSMNQATTSAQQLGAAIQQSVTGSQQFLSNIQRAASLMGQMQNFNPFAQNAAPGAPTQSMQNMQSMQTAISQATAGMTQFNTMAGTVANNLQQMAAAMQNVNTAAQQAAQSIQNTQPATQQAAQSAQQVAGALGQAATSANVVVPATNRVANNMTRAGSNANAGASGIRRFINSLRELHLAQRIADTSLGRLIGQFMRIARMRMMRYVIREIAKSIKEGLENYKQYSKAIGGDYYKAVTSLNDATLKMKNSIGAALAPAIRMLIPYIQQAVHWFIDLLNVVNQFFALLAGQSTWSKALDFPSESLDETAESASRAAKELKELLADFDELNIIQSESGGGGVGKIGKDEPDYTEMFQEVSKFDEKIKSIVEWIKSNMGLIKEIAMTIGGIILGWRISSLFTDNIRTIIGMALALYGTFKMVTTMIDQLKNGVTFENLIESLKGLGLVVLGLGIRFGFTGIAVGLVIGGFIELVAPMKELIETGKLTDAAFTQLEISIGMLATGFAILTHSWIPLLIGAIAGIGIAVWANWDDISKWWNNNVSPFLMYIVDWIGTGVVQPIVDAWNFLSENLNAVWEGIKVAFANLWNNGILPVARTVKTAVVDTIVNYFEFMGEGLGIVWDTIVSAWDGLWIYAVLPLVNWVNQEIVTPIVDWFTGMWSALGVAWDGIVTLWNNFWYRSIHPLVDFAKQSVVDPIVDWFTGMWGQVISAWESVKEWWNSFWHALETAGSIVDTYVIGPIAGFFTRMWDNIADYFEENRIWWDAFWNTDMGRAVTEFVPGIVNSIADYFSGVWDDIKTVYNGAASWFGNFWSNEFLPIISFMKTEITDPIAKAFSDMWASIVAAASELDIVLWWNTVWNVGFKKLVDDIDQNIISPIKTYFSTLWQSIKDSEFLSNVSVWWKNLWTVIFPAILTNIDTGIIQPIVKFFTDLWDSIKTTGKTGNGEGGLEDVIGGFFIDDDGVLTKDFDITVGLNIKNIREVKWGDYNASKDEIETYIQTSMFKDYKQMTARIELINTTVSASKAEREKITGKVQRLFWTINALTVGVDTNSSMTEIMTQVNDLITETETYAETQTAVLRTAVSVMPVIDASGQDISKDVLEAGITGWATITGYMNQLGQDLSQAMIDGTTGKLRTNWDVEAVNEILTKINNINRAIATATAASNARNAMMTGLSSLTKESFGQVMDIYNEYIETMRQSYYDIEYEAITALEVQAATLRQMAADTKDAAEAAKLTTMADTIEENARTMRANVHDTVNAAVEKEIGPAKQLVQDWLDTVLKDGFLGANFSPDLAEGMAQQLFIGIEDSMGDPKKMKEAMQGVVAGLTGIPVNAFKILDITGWDYLSKEIQDKMVQTFAEMYGKDYAISKLSRMGIDVSSLIGISTEGVVEAMQESGEDVKNAAEVFNELLNQYGIDKFKEIIDIMQVEFGWSFDEVWASVFESDLFDDEMFVTLLDKFTEYKETLETSPNAPDTSAFDKGMNDMAENARKSVESVRASLNGLNGITVGFTGGIFGGSFSVTMPQMMAGGGFPGAGEMFIAREAGPEMVGRIGNRTAVANNDQIVNGISNGVAAGMGKANEETDALLGQAVSLLSQILRKTGTLQPSAALGRTIKQSSEMYARSGG